MNIWFVDDLPQNRSAWHQSFGPELQQNHSFESFERVEELFEALDSRDWPEILFVDFYIGPRYGHEVIDYFKDAVQRPCLIAYSSQASANRAMLAQGADIAFPKITGAAPSSEIAQRIKSDADLLALCQLKSSD